jgi:hypothetical protein
MYVISHLANEFDIITLDILDDHDLHFGQKVKSQLVDGVSQNALLDQQDIAVGSLDLLDNVQNVLTLLLEDTVHLSVIIDYDVVFHLNSIKQVNECKLDERKLKYKDSYIGLGWRDAELNEADFGLLDPLRAIVT